MRKKKREEAGFTLIEAMITTLVVAIALLGYLGATITMEQNTEQAYEKTIALQDAQRVIEQMRNLAQTGTFPANVTSVYGNNNTVSGYANLNSETVTVSYVNTTVNPLDVTVTVTWMANGRRSVTQALRTLMTQRIT